MPTHLKPPGVSADSKHMVLYLHREKFSLTTCFTDSGHKKTTFSRGFR